MTIEEAKKILERIVNTSNELTHPVILNTEIGAIKVAIDALQAHPTLDDVSTAFENGYKQGKFEAQQWIPCSERLPKKNGEYLVTVRENSRSAFNGEATVYQDTFQFLCQWDDCGNDVIAWMEIPEPYKEKE